MKVIAILASLMYSFFFLSFANASPITFSKMQLAANNMQNSVNNSQANSNSSDDLAISNQYNNKNALYSIMYPASWLYEEKSKNETQFYPKKGADTDGIVVTVNTIPITKNNINKFDIDYFVKVAKNKFIQMDSNVKFIDSGNMNISHKDGTGFSARYFIAVLNVHGISLKVFVMVARSQGGNVYYNYLFAAPENLYDKYRYLIDNTVKTMRI